MGLVLLSIQTAVVSAAPLIQSVAGDPSSGGTLVITGSGFGQAAQIISWDDFENGTLNDPLGTPVIGPEWSFQHPSSNTPVTHYSSERRFSGGASAKVVWKEPGWSGYSINAFGWNHQGPFQGIYLTYWRYHDPSSLDITDKNHKQLYCFGDGTDGAYSDLQQFIPFMVPAGNSGFAAYLQNTPIGRWDYGSVGYGETSRVWNRWESYFRYESTVSSDDGYFEVWVDGELVRQESNLNMCEVPGGNAVHDIRIGHMFGGYGSMEYVRSYFDDVYIATSRARVEIGNAPVFGNCTKREIQIPTAWENGVLTIDCHYSEMAQEANTYIFVVDENGLASPGFPIDLESEPVDDTTAPVVTISSPVGNGGTYVTDASTVTLSGDVNDASAIISITWTSSNGGSGNIGTALPWTLSSVPLSAGDNFIRVRAIDSAGNQGVAQITVQLDPPGPPGTPERLP